MSKSRMVSLHANGWADKDNSASKPVKVYPTQAEAISSAREHLRNQGGGELSIQGTDGKIRAKDTVPHGNDPFPPKG